MVNPEEVAGLPCPGCGIGDQLEIEALGGLVRNGQVFHDEECWAQYVADSEGRS